MVNIRLMWYFEFHNCINLQQSGLHRNRSTTDHLTHHQNDLFVSMSLHLHTIVVFFDRTKAYDIAWRYGILKKLYDFWLRGHLPIFIRNFMTSRMIQVRVGDVLSDSVGVQEGTPTGSALSCTRFMVAINDILSTLSENGSKTDHGVGYALVGDGIAVSRRIQNFTSVFTAELYKIV